jgi:hypothetical protein
MRGRRGRAVDVDDLGHLRAALTRRHPHLQRFAGLDLLDADPPQHAGVQERIAAAIRKLDKAEPAIAAKPFHHRLYRRPRRLLVEPRRAVTRCGSVAATAAAVFPSAATTAAAKIIVKIAPPTAIPMPSSVFHVKFQSRAQGRSTLQTA